jgi:hypothetical protein
MDAIVDGMIGGMIGFGIGLLILHGGAWIVRRFAARGDAK